MVQSQECGNMSLTFELQYTEPNLKSLKIGHENDNLLVQYFLDGDDRLNNRSTVASNGIYDDLTFSREARRITAVPVTNFGIKTFPQFGAYGFYTPKYGDGTSRVLAPINPKRSTNQKPYVELEQVGTEVVARIKDPSIIQYDCFRIMFRQEHFATEFITYDKEITVKVDPGLYNVTVMGYTDDGKHSVESTSLMKELTQPYTIPQTPVMIVSWSPDSKYVAIGCLSDTEISQRGLMAYRVDESTKRLVKLSDPGGDPIVSVAELSWNETSTMLAAKTAFGDISYFNISTSSYSKTTSTFATRFENNRQIQTSPSGQYIIYATGDLVWFEVNDTIGFTVT